MQTMAAGSAKPYVGAVSPMELEQASRLLFQVSRSPRQILAQSCCGGMHVLNSL